MSQRNLGLEMQLESRRGKLERLKKRIEKIDQKIAEGVDFEEEDKLEIRKEGIFQQITQVDEEILRFEQQQQQAQRSELLMFLEAEEDYFENILQAYQRTVFSWSTSAPFNVNRVSAVVTELERMGESDTGYSATEAFVAYLIQESQNANLIRTVKNWGNKCFPGRDWLRLYQQIEEAREERNTALNPAIMIRIALAEEATVQAENIDHYRIKSWLIHDVKEYQRQQKKRTGYSPLSCSSKLELQPVKFDILEANLQPVLGQLIKESREILGRTQDPEFYIFLPKSLLLKAVDCWSLQDDLDLGCGYKVILCALDRWDGAYPVRPWWNFWEMHDSCLCQKPEEIFVSGNDEEMPQLIQALERAKNENKVGLKINQAPCPTRSDKLFSALFLKGVPLAVWGRCSKPAIDNNVELDGLLGEGTVEELPETVRRKRDEARNIGNSADNHIGYHLSLLRDNPNLTPPRTA